MQNLAQVAQDARIMKTSQAEHARQTSLDADSDIDRACVLVLGMHRSGTSALSGLLCLAGCDQPANQITPLKENPKGFFESRVIKELNDEILASVGSAWHDWTELDCEWGRSPQAASFRARASDALKEEFGSSPLFVLKDPRICRFAPFWIQVLQDMGCHPHIMHIHRNPLEVAASLKERNGFDRDYGLLLWLRHVLDAEAATRGELRHFVNYAEMLDNPVRTVARALEAFGLCWPRTSDVAKDETEGFISSELRHFSESAEQVIANPTIAQWVRKTFEILEHWAAKGEDVRDYAALDLVRTAFTSAVPMFARLIREGRYAMEANRKMMSEMKDAQKSVEKYKCESMAHLEKIEALEASAAVVSASRIKLEAAQTALDKAEVDLSEARAASDGKQRKIAELQDQLLGLNSAVAERFEEIARLTAMLIKAEQEKQAVSARMTQVDAHRDALLASTSWRMTGPVRRVIDGVRRLRRQR